MHFIGSVIDYYIECLDIRQGLFVRRRLIVTSNDTCTKRYVIYKTKSVQNITSIKKGKYKI